MAGKVWYPAEQAAWFSAQVRLGQPGPHFNTPDPDAEWRDRFMSAPMRTHVPEAIIQFGDGALARLAVEARDHLAQSLLAYGGWAICNRGIDLDLGRLLEGGILISGEKTATTRGRPCDCHENSARYWEKNQRSSLMMTGYALSDDGLWREHSWIVENRARGPMVVETTEKRLAYFGFVQGTADMASLLGLVSKLRRDDVLADLQESLERVLPADQTLRAGAFAG